MPIVQPPFTDAQWQSIARGLVLSKRQLDILKSLFQGDSEKEISGRLSISQNTVHTHLKRLHSRLGVHSRAELMIAIMVALRNEDDTPLGSRRP